QFANNIAQFVNVILIHGVGGAEMRSLIENGRPCKALSAFLNVLSKFCIAFCSSVPGTIHSSSHAGHFQTAFVESEGMAIIVLQFLHSNSKPKTSLTSMRCFVSNVTELPPPNHLHSRNPAQLPLPLPECSGVNYGVSRSYSRRSTGRRQLGSFLISC